MDFQKAGILLEKINTLFKNLSDDEGGSISEIEKDLMRAYLRQFYEYFMSRGESAGEEAPASIELPVERKEKKKPEPPKPAKEPKPAPPSRYVQDDDEDEDEAPAPKVIPVPAEVKSPRTKEISRGPEDDDVETLFEHHQAKEVSEKLSELPIPDLAKAMGLNERIFTVNELFDGDQDAFKQTIQVLNGLTSFEEAKNFLVREAAFRYNWAHPEKKNKAKNFIKLVRRRYNG